MTIPLQEFNNALDNFLDISILYNEQQLRYKFQGICTSEICKNDFKKKIVRLEVLLFNQLKNGLNNKKFLNQTRKTIWETSNFLYDIYFDDYNDLKKSELKIRKTFKKIETNREEKFDYSYFADKKHLEKNNVEDNDIRYYHDHLSDFFEEHERINNVNPSQLQFENVKLLYIIDLYKNELFTFLDKIDYLFQECDKIDFKKNDEYTISENKYKCHSSLNKLKTAQLFKLLIDEGYLFIDKQNLGKNETLMKKFFACNFTFNKNGIQTDIVLINQEFSELKWEHKESQIQFIDELIGKLEVRKKEILDFREPNKFKEID